MNTLAELGILPTIHTFSLTTTVAVKSFQPLALRKRCYHRTENIALIISPLSVDASNGRNVKLELLDKLPCALGQGFQLLQIRYLDDETRVHERQEAIAFVWLHGPALLAWLVRRKCDERLIARPYKQRQCGRLCRWVLQYGKAIKFARYLTAESRQNVIVVASDHLAVVSPAPQMPPRLVLIFVALDLER